MEVLFYKNVLGWTKIKNNLSKKRAFLLLNGFWGALRQIPTKNCKYIFRIAYWIPGLTLVDIVESLKFFYATQ